MTNNTYIILNTGTKGQDTDGQANKTQAEVCTKIEVYENMVGVRSQ